MADATVARFGVQGSTGGTTPSMTERTALFLKVFGGEVLTQFEQSTVMLDKHVIRTIASGKSASFPQTNRVTSAYHLPGVEITGQAILGNEIVITIDGLLVSSVFVDSLDEMISHFDVRSVYSTEMGRRLATNFDQSCMMEVMRGAKAEPNTSITGIAAASKVQVTGTNFGDTATVANMASWLATAIFKQAAIWDLYFVPGVNRYCVVGPTQYNALVQNTTAINSDWGGSGAYCDGTVFKIGGVNIVKSGAFASIMNTSTAGLTTGAAAGRSISVAHGASGDSDVAGLMFTDQAVGTIKLLDISVESAYDIRRQGTLLVAKYAMGHGVLNPDCCAYIKNTA